MNSTIRLNIKLDTKEIPNFLTLSHTVTTKSISQNIQIEGTIENFPFQSTLEVKTGSHKLKLSRAMQDIIRKYTEEKVSIEITRIGDEVETRIPADLQKALVSHTKAYALWKKITPLARRDWIFWILSGRKLETRKIRIEKACSKLASGMRRVCCFAGISWVK